MIGKENIFIALGSIKDNLLRAVLTLLIIAVGIGCMVGMLTAIDNILYSMSSNFNKLGANSFSISPSGENIRSRKKGKKEEIGDPISYRQAMDFKDAYHYGASEVSVTCFGKNGVKATYKNKHTTPTIKVYGMDENYLSTSSYDLAAGRNFTVAEVRSGGNKAIIGHDLVSVLFDGDADKSIGKNISVDGERYKVIGALKKKGSSSGSRNDKKINIPLMNAKKKYGFARKNYDINVSIKSRIDMDDAVSQAIGVMRNIRGLRSGEDNDFEIRKSNGIMETLKSMTFKLRMGTIIIAGLTLLGAAIGLMNIMLVSVTERTKEIGIRKALGATKMDILSQFLVEAIIICIIGGLVGIFFGLLLGLGVTFLVNGVFVVPWMWMLLGIVVCIFVGVISGIYPAVKASGLDPIEALRYE